MHRLKNILLPSISIPPPSPPDNPFKRMTLCKQARGRRYCARCRAIRLARARVAKFIDPTSNLPYWVHPGTGITSWTKPKIFGADDVEQAITVATSRTEHLVSWCGKERSTKNIKRPVSQLFFWKFPNRKNPEHEREGVLGRRALCCHP